MEEVVEFPTYLCFSESLFVNLSVYLILQLRILMWSREVHVDLAQDPPLQWQLTWLPFLWELKRMAPLFAQLTTTQ